MTNTFRLTTAQAIVKFLDNQYVSMDGVETKFVEGFFTIFGHGIAVGLGEALDTNPGGLKVMQGRNEQGMCHTAIAFAKQNGRKQIIACASSVGPGAANMVTACATATVNNIPLTNADIITGVSMMLLFVLAVDAWNGSLGSFLDVKLSMGFWSLLVAHITFDIPYVILSVTPKLRQLDPNIYEAAQDLGDHGFHAFRAVVLPEIMPGVINGLIMAFTLSIDDFVISYFTSGTTQTLPIYIYSMTRKRVSPEINALSTVLFAAVMALLIVVNVRNAKARAKDKA